MRLDEFEDGHNISEAEYEERESGLRVDLLNAQFDLSRSDLRTLILVAGDDRDGCHELIDLFHEWLDARRLDTQVFLERSVEETRYPPFWRYWRALPATGRIGIYYGAWAYDAIAGQLFEKRSEKRLARLVAHVQSFERLLAAEGTAILKLWVHTPKSELGKRLRKAKKRPHGWRATEADERLHALHDEVVELAEDLLERTDAPHAPWVVVEGGDDAYRDLTAAEALRDALVERLAAEAQAPRAVPARQEEEPSGALVALDLGAKLESREYKRRLDVAQGRLSDLSIEARERNVATVLVFEGWDAAGKGGVIRRMTRAMAAQDYRVFPIAAPTEEERARPYLWRFWRRLGPRGRVTIFDRSWYGRVLVERVEGFADEAEWRRAYDEINDFERVLTEDGAVLLKFWLQIDREEQLRRFEAREKTPYKKYKLTAEDYRNRARWDEYTEAAEEMFARTNSMNAPWALVSANDKRHARVTVIEAVCAALERALK